MAWPSSARVTYALPKFEFRGGGTLGAGLVMQALPAQDVVLLQSLVDGDIPLPVLLRWADPRNHGGLPPVHHFPPDATPPPESNAPWTPERSTTTTPCVVEDSHPWKDQLDSTSPRSFALSFLHYMRAQLQPFFAAADCSSAPAPLNSSSRLETRGLASPTPEDGVCRDQGTRNCALVVPQVTKKGGVPASASSPRRSGQGATGTGNVYDSEFPALAPLPAAKQRRRVTPTPTAEIVVDTAFVLANVDLSNTTRRGQRKGKRFEPRSLKLDMDMLMQRCEAKQKDKENAVQEAERASVQPWGCAAGSESTTAHAPAPKDTADETLKHSTSPGARQPLSVGGSTTTTLPFAAEPPEESGPKESGPPKDPAPPADRAVPLPSGLLRVCTVHATLMVSRMVPSLLGELQFLLQILTLPSTTCTKVEAGEAANLFRGLDDCSKYACEVLHQAGRLLECVGEYLLSALVDEPAIARHSPQLLARTKAALADQRGASQRSGKAYETAAAAHALQSSPSTSLQPDCGPRLLVSVPFQPARDSRHNFRTPEEIKFYNNREQCRDLFYSLVRDAAAAYSAFGSGALESELGGFNKMKESANQFLRGLLPDNYPWFAEFFLEQVLQVYLCGNPDPHIAGLARQDQVKLQKLHDRLSGTTSASSTCTRQQKQGTQGDARLDLSPSSPWSQVKNTQPKGIAMKRGNTSSSRSLQDADKAFRGNNHPLAQEVSQSRFSGLFPQFMQVYIWFLEATDSHRLNTHLIWSIKYKIANLSEVLPGDPANFGSGFTQRVLTLKAFAGLLGFFSFSPGVGTVPLTSVTGAASEGWPVFRDEPPVDVEGVLHMAKDKGQVLLVLPWVVEFLRLSKADRQVRRQPYFHRSLTALKNLYLLPALDPFHQDFGVGSLCILAELDNFFEYMELPVNTDSIVSQDKPAVACSSGRSVPGRREGAGIDNVPGIVDTRYIVHCCPLLAEMRLGLLEGKRRVQRVHVLGRSPGPGRQLRKITPVQSRCEWQLDSQSPGFPEKKNTPSTNTSETLKFSLQRNFLEQRPKLRTLVDFLVDVVAVNAASEAVSKFVPQVMVDACEKLGSSICFNQDTSAENALEGLVDKSSRVDRIAEQIISSAICSSLPAASRFLQAYTSERISQAFSILICPNEVPTVIGVAAGIAAEAASLSAQQKALARISTEIRKQVIEVIRSQRDQVACMSTKPGLCPSHTGPFAQPMLQLGPSLGNRVSNCVERTVVTEDAKPGSAVFQTELELQTGQGSRTGVSPQHITTDVSRQDSIQPASILHRSTKVTANVKRQLAFSGRSGKPADDDVNGVTGCPEREPVLVNNIVQACSQARHFIKSGFCSDHRRNLGRQHLSVLCLSIEALLSQVGGLPSGGADGLVAEKKGELTEFSCVRNANEREAFLKFESRTMNHLRAEVGLIRRSVALAFRLCCTSPHLAFGLKVGMQVPQCFCDLIVRENLVTLQSVHHISVESINVEACGEELFPSSASNQSGRSTGQWGSSTTVFAPATEFSGCQQVLWFEKNLAGLMLELVRLWKVIVSQGICSLTFLMDELLAPWRWAQAVHDLWRDGESWIETKHGLIGVVLRMIHESPAVEEVERTVKCFLETLYGAPRRACSEQRVQRGIQQNLALAVGLHAFMRTRPQKL